MVEEAAFVAANLDRAEAQRKFTASPLGRFADQPRSTGFHRNDS
jgi:hypothetical protein